jgi:hypothetical protein
VYQVSKAKVPEAGTIGLSICIPARFTDKSTI